MISAVEVDSDSVVSDTAALAVQSCAQQTYDSSVTSATVDVTSTIVQTTSCTSHFYVISDTTCYTTVTTLMLPNKSTSSTVLRLTEQCIFSQTSDSVKVCEKLAETSEKLAVTSDYTSCTNIIYSLDTIAPSIATISSALTNSVSVDTQPSFAVSDGHSPFTRSAFHISNPTGSVKNLKHQPAYQLTSHFADDKPMSFALNESLNLSQPEFVSREIITNTHKRIGPTCKTLLTSLDCTQIDDFCTKHCRFVQLIEQNASKYDCIHLACSCLLRFITFLESGTYTFDEAVMLFDLSNPIACRIKGWIKKSYPIVYMIKLYQKIKKTDRFGVCMHYAVCLVQNGVSDVKASAIFGLDLQHFRCRLADLMITHKDLVGLPYSKDNFCTSPILETRKQSNRVNCSIKGEDTSPSSTSVRNVDFSNTSLDISCDSQLDAVTKNGDMSTNHNDVSIYHTLNASKIFSETAVNSTEDSSVKDKSNIGFDSDFDIKGDFNDSKSNDASDELYSSSTQVEAVVKCRNAARAADLYLSGKASEEEAKKIYCDILDEDFETACSTINNLPKIISDIRDSSLRKAISAIARGGLPQKVCRTYHLSNWRLLSTLKKLRSLGKIPKYMGFRRTMNLNDSEKLSSSNSLNSTSQTSKKTRNQTNQNTDSNKKISRNKFETKNLNNSDSHSTKLLQNSTDGKITTQSQIDDNIYILKIMLHFLDKNRLIYGWPNSYSFWRSLIGQNQRLLINRRSSCLLRNFNTTNWLSLKKHIGLNIAECVERMKNCDPEESMTEEQLDKFLVSIDKCFKSLPNEQTNQQVASAKIKSEQHRDEKSKSLDLSELGDILSSAVLSVSEGLSVKEASQMFNVSRNMLQRICRRKGVLCDSLKNSVSVSVSNAQPTADVNSQMLHECALLVAQGRISYQTAVDRSNASIETIKSHMRSCTCISSLQRLRLRGHWSTSMMNAVRAVLTDPLQSMSCVRSAHTHHVPRLAVMCHVNEVCQILRRMFTEARVREAIRAIEDDGKSFDDELCLLYGVKYYTLVYYLRRYRNGERLFMHFNVNDTSVYASEADVDRVIGAVFEQAALCLRMETAGQRPSLSAVCSQFCLDECSLAIFDWMMTHSTRSTTSNANSSSCFPINIKDLYKLSDYMRELLPRCDGNIKNLPHTTKAVNGYCFDLANHLFTEWFEKRLNLASFEQLHLFSDLFLLSSEHLPGPLTDFVFRRYSLRWVCNKYGTTPQDIIHSLEVNERRCVYDDAVPSSREQSSSHTVGRCTVNAVSNCIDSLHIGARKRRLSLDGGKRVLADLSAELTARDSGAVSSDSSECGDHSVSPSSQYSSEIAKYHMVTGDTTKRRRQSTHDRSAARRVERPSKSMNIETVNSKNLQVSVSDEKQCLDSERMYYSSDIVGFSAREAVESVLLLGEHVKTISERISLSEDFIYFHCRCAVTDDRKLSERPRIGDEVFVCYTLLSLIWDGWNINTDSIQWCMCHFLRLIRKNVPKDASWLQLDVFCKRWPELEGNISTARCQPNKNFQTLFKQRLRLVIEEFEEANMNVIGLTARKDVCLDKSIIDMIPKPFGHDPDQVEFDVEDVLAVRLNIFIGALEYLIKWHNYSDHWNTWEPSSNIDCKDILDRFEQNWISLSLDQRYAVIQHRDPSRFYRLLHDMFYAQYNGIVKRQFYDRHIPSELYESFKFWFKSSSMQLDEIFFNRERFLRSRLGAIDDNIEPGRKHGAQRDESLSELRVHSSCTEVKSSRRGEADSSNFTNNVKVDTSQIALTESSSVSNTHLQHPQSSECLSPDGVSSAMTGVIIQRQAYEKSNENNAAVSDHKKIINQHDLISSNAEPDSNCAPIESQSLSTTRNDVCESSQSGHTVPTVNREQSIKDDVLRQVLTETGIDSQQITREYGNLTGFDACLVAKRLFDNLKDCVEAKVVEIMKSRQYSLLKRLKRKSLVSRKFKADITGGVFKRKRGRPRKDAANCSTGDVRLNLDDTANGPFMYNDDVFVSCDARGADISGVSASATMINRSTNDCAANSLQPVKRRRRRKRKADIVTQNVESQLSSMVTVRMSDCRLDLSEAGRESKTKKKKSAVCESQPQNISSALTLDQSDAIIFGQPETVTLDLNSMLCDGGGLCSDDVGYFDMNGQFIEHSYY